MFATILIIGGLIWAYSVNIFDGAPSLGESWAEGVLLIAGADIVMHLLGVPQ